MTKKTDASDTAPKGNLAKRKKKTKATTGPEFASYISKLHKARQDASGDARTISKDAIMTLESMSDHVVNLLVEHGKRVSRLTKTTTFKVDEAKAATTLALTGALRDYAIKAGHHACDSYKATLPAKTAKKAQEAAEAQ